MMRTYDEIYKAMAESYTEQTGIVPDEKSDFAIRLRVLAGEIYSAMVNMQWLKGQMFFSTAQGEYLDLHAEARGIGRRKGTKAQGVVTFSVDEVLSEDVIIPKGTIVASELTLLRYETLGDAVLRKGELTVDVVVRSEDVGKKYNVTAGTVTYMVTALPFVDSVTNAESFAGGCDKESDESLRKRIRLSIKFPVNSTNCAYYKSLAESVDGVSSAGVVPRGRGAGTVDVYVAADGAVCSDEAVEKAQNLLSIQREVNVDVHVKKAEPVPIDLYFKLQSLEGYDYESVKADCVKALEDFIISQGVSSEVLLCQVSECICHVEGVKEHSFISGVSRDYRKIDGKFPVPGEISVVRSYA